MVGQRWRKRKKKYDKAVVSFCGSIILGFIMLITPGEMEIAWAFALMCWFAGFLKALRFRYRKYYNRLWLEEIMENMILLGFTLPGILGTLSFNPWIACMTGITGMSIYFILWRLYFEDFIHRFWW